MPEGLEDKISRLKVARVSRRSLLSGGETRVKCMQGKRMTGNTSGVVYPRLVLYQALVNIFFGILLSVKERNPSNT